MTSPSLELPDGNLYVLTWSIPRQFGGLTKSLLQRACQLATASGREIVVITLSDQPNLDEERAALRERGLLVEGVSILNLWEELDRAADDVWADAPFDPTITSAELGTPGVDEPADDVGEILSPGGTVVARQLKRTVDEDGVPTQHRDDIIRTEIWDGATFHGGWHGAWPLWRWWLDRVLARPAHVIVDSPNVADCLVAAPLADVPVTYVVHNSHVSGTREAPYGRLGRWRSFTITRAHGFDAVVYLTHAQRDHVDLLFGPQDNSHVVPHAIEPAASDPKRKRPAGRGIVMANLEGRKRIPHAVRAVATASRSAPSVELNIYGRGPEEDQVLAAIEEHRAPARLEGYTSDPAGAFADSSYMLLTSSHEGFGLVLVESMAAGSLPIAYDIEYGPADIVNDGKDGFLVPKGDEEALAATIAEVANASRRRLRRMRKAAARRAADFLPSAVLPSWGPVLEAAAERARARAGRPEPTLDEVRELERVASLYRYTDVRLEATIGDVTWDESSVATVSLSCVLVGAEELGGKAEVDVELVHRPTGVRSTPPTLEELESDPAGEHPATRLRFTIDPSALEQPADHVVLLRARLGAIDVLDTPQPHPDAPAYLPLPVPSPARPVLVPARRSGLRLVTASPHVFGSVELASDHVLVDVTALAADAKVEAVEALALDGERSIEAERRPDGRHRLPVDADGRWKVRARTNGRWRDLAWRGPELPPGGDGPIRVELSPRGYVRLSRDEDPEQPH
jgi:poly(glycerol-phosphate) alpha-glucosyltransferase